jgi:vacuolar-type H+-ATPase subunit F/Vma7
MTVSIYLGDEVSAAGYRLAGVRVRTPDAGDSAAALAAARADASLVLVSAAVAVHIPEAQMRTALATLMPLTLIVPDLRGQAPVPDVGARLRRQLGLEG